MEQEIQQAKFAPFLIVKRDEKFVLTLGECIASQKEFDSVEEANEYLRKEPYEMMLNVIAICKYYESKDKKQPKKSMEKSTKKSV